MRLSRTNVFSGNYKVSKKSNEILEAFLGTCVGVTLCDPKKGIGGLLHILLPAPPRSDYSWQPTSYATTGLPLFINEMVKAGAKKENLTATIAGGALVGPVSEMDLNLDIGGRTADFVEKILAKDKIQIDKIETGGYFTCKLGLNLKTLKSVIEPVSLDPGSDRKGKISKPDLKDFEKTLEKVRPIPQIALKIIRMIRDNMHSMEDLAKEVRQDQVISAKVIRLLNSALFGQSSSVDSIDRALVMMGEKKFLQLVISASMENFFPENGLGYSLCKGGVFKHALGTAMICENLANMSGKVSSDIAYTAGLLHDIGKVALDQYIASALPMFYRRTQVDGSSLITVESEEFGINHTEVGGKLADLWALPESLKEAIMYHHFPEQSVNNSELTHLVYVADLLMSRFVVGQELDRLNTDQFNSRLIKAGFGDINFESVIDSIPRQIFSPDIAEL